MSNDIIYDNDFVFHPYNHQYSSSPPPHQPFRPSSSSSSSSFTEFFTGGPTSGQSDLDRLESSSHPFLHHHLPCPHTQFEIDDILSVFLQHHDHGHDHNQEHRDGEIVIDHHRQPSLDLPLNNNTIEDYSVDASETITYMDDSKKNSGSQEHTQLSNKRSSKRDRHSKITTAKGLRDRRMRLSLEVARPFFGLQDMLGFDKASKTVEWLLTKANSEIDKLARSFPHKVNHSFCSNSSNNTSVDDLSRSGSIEETGKSKSSKGIKPGKEKKPRSQSRKPVFRIVPKDLRAKARERAKERTKEKWMTERRSSEVLVKMNNKNSNYEQVGTSNWSSFETGKDSIARSHNNNNNLSFQEMEELSTNHQSTACNNMGMNQEDIADESLAAINKWSPFSILNHHNHGATSVEHQFTDVQLLGRPWEFVYNAQNMC